MPLFSKPYRNLENPEKLVRSEVVREVAARTHVKEAVVNEVLDAFQAVATEEIVNKGKFSFLGLFSVGTYHTKETNTGMAIIPAGPRLKSRLNAHVKNLWNAKKKSGIDEPESYQELVDNYIKGTTGKRRDSIGLLQEEDDFYNPLLEDDDDY